MRKRVAVIISHPIQHFCPQYANWAKRPEVDLKVFFASNHGLVAYEDKNFDRIIKWAGLNLDFPYEFLPGENGKPVDIYIDSKDLEERLTAFSPEAIVSYGYAQKLQRRALAWAKSANIPVFMISDSELRTSRNWVKNFIKSIILPRIFKNVSLFLSVGDANETYYRKYGVRDDRLVRCSFPIDVIHYDSILAKRDESRFRVRAELGIPMHHKVLLMVGKLVLWKRQADLVLFSNLIQGRRSDITVVLAGTGPEEVALRALTKRIGVGGVVFAGFISPEILAEYYCASDVYVHCSEQEPHSLAISEAIYCGLPVVLSHTCGSYGPTDDVQLGLNGFAYQCGNIGDLSRILLYVLEEDVCAPMAAASHCIARHNQKLAHGEALGQALSLMEFNRLS